MRLDQSQNEVRLMGILVNANEVNYFEFSSRMHFCSSLSLKFRLSCFHLQKVSQFVNLVPTELHTPNFRSYCFPEIMILVIDSRLMERFFIEIFYFIDFYFKFYAIVISLVN